VLSALPDQLSALLGLLSLRLSQRHGPSGEQEPAHRQTAGVEDLGTIENPGTNRVVAYSGRHLRGSSNDVLVGADLETTVQTGELIHVCESTLVRTAWTSRESSTPLRDECSSRPLKWPPGPESCRSRVGPPSGESDQPSVARPDPVPPRRQTALALEAHPPETTRQRGRPLTLGLHLAGGTTLSHWRDQSRPASPRRRPSRATRPHRRR
jgi:hypothetical protein